MNAALLGIICLLTAVSSCSKEKKDPENPVAFTRYSKDIVMQSSKLNASIKYSVYLPEKYVENKTERYGVVYLLHGYGDDNNSWNDQYLRVSSIINSLEADGSVSPMIYVMPQGFKTYYVNRYSGTYNYMDMFTEELVPYIDKTLRTIPDKKHRAVVGYSMGGYGAMILPSKNMDLFSVSAPLSMSFRTDKQYMTESSGGWDNQWGYIFGGEGESGRARLTDYYKLHNPFYFFTSESASSFSSVKYFLDCGDDEEQLLIANDTLHVQMKALNIAHEFRVRNGAHTSDYWRTAVKEVLPFIDDCFNGREYRKEESISVKVKDIPNEEKVVKGCTVKYYYPENYNKDSEYPSLYFIYDEIETGFFSKAISIVDTVRKSSNCVIVTCNSTEMSVNSLSMSELKSASEYKSNGKIIGLGCREGGKIVYNASVADNVFKSVFMIEAAINSSISLPNRDVFYYFSFTDQSKYYSGADALYQYCKYNNIEYQYRVYNGIESSNSILYGLSNMISAIKEQIK